MGTPLPPQTMPLATPDDHIRVLETMAADFERCAGYLRTPHDTRYGQLLLKRAAAIRWLLAETAYGVDNGEIVI